MDMTKRLEIERSKASITILLEHLLRIVVDADADDRLIRVISRDCIERGRTPQMVIDRYERVLKPMHLKHIEPAKRLCDLIIPQGGHNEVAIQLLTDYIKGRLNKK